MRYAVVTACRMLYTLETPQVASKPEALAWASQQFDERWQPLLAQVREDRSIGFDRDEPPRPGTAADTRAFVQHIVGRAERHH